MTSELIEMHILHILSQLLCAKIPQFHQNCFFSDIKEKPYYKEGNASDKCLQRHTFPSASIIRQKRS